MIYKELDNKSLKKYVIIAVAVFALLAHGFCYFNIFYTHDSLLAFEFNMATVKELISHGRFIQPLFFLIDKNIPSPSLVGCFSVIFISISVYFILKLFELTDLISVLLISGIMVVNATVTLTNATYLHNSTCYFAALALAVCGVYVVRTDRRKVWLGSLLIFLSLGLYQSYSQVSLALFMLLLMKDMLTKADIKEIIKNGIRYFITLLSALVVYYVVFVTLRAVLNVEASGYNNLSSVGDYSGFSQIVHSLVYTYGKVALYIIYPYVAHRYFIAILNIFVLLFCATAYFVLLKKYNSSVGKMLLSILLIIIMPFAMNYTCFLAKGVGHGLMLYSVNLVYVWGLYLLKEVLKKVNSEGFEKATISRLKVTCNMVAVILCIIICDGIIFSNQVYLQKNLIYQNTNLVMNRVIDRIEQVDGYVPGKTPVCFIGELSSSEISPSYDDFKNSGVGLEHSTGITYYKTYENYFNHVLRYPVNVISVSKELQKSQIVKDMPAFPSSDCCRMIDGVLVFKFSE